MRFETGTKELFTLDYAEAMLVKSAFFAAYAIVSIPAAEARRNSRQQRHRDEDCRFAFFTRG